MLYKFGKSGNYGADEGYVTHGTNIVHSSFRYGKNCSMGAYNIIGPNVVIGDNVQIENYVLLKEGTVIGDNCYVDSYFRSSGDNKIGNNCTLRFGSTIARKVYVGNGVFISPNCMTIFSQPDGSKSAGTYIYDGAFIGTAAVLCPNITIEKNVVIGAQSYVNKSCLSPGGIYVGSPIKQIK